MAFPVIPRFNQLLAVAWPAVSTINWKAFGGKFVDYDDTGVPKYTGIISHSVSGSSTVGPNTQVFGFLPRPEKSARIVVKKIVTLQAVPAVKASIQMRNPDSDQWGGGIRSSYFPSDICALSGLPEIGDHLLCAQIMRDSGILTNEDWQVITDANNVQTDEARAYVDMSIEQFQGLKRLIYATVKAAMRTSQHTC